jgi:hypothetical protein
MKKKRQFKIGVMSLFVLSAAFVVFSIVNALVSHAPSEISPQGSNSGLNADMLDREHASAFTSGTSSTGGGSSGAVIMWGTYNTNDKMYLNPGNGAPSCPSGWVEVYAGYGPFLLGTTDLANFAELQSVEVCANSPTLLVSNVSFSGTDSYHENATAYACDLIASGRYHCNTCRVCVPESTTTGVVPVAGDTILYTGPAHNGFFGATAAAARTAADVYCTNNIPAGLSVSGAKAFLSFTAADEIQDLHSTDSDYDGKTGPFESSKPIYGYNANWSQFAKMATNWRDLLDGTIMQTISYAVGPSASRYWSGSNYYGVVYPIPYDAYCEKSCNCYGWTTNSAPVDYDGDGDKDDVMGKFAVTDRSITGWLAYWFDGCNQAYPILCVATYN